MKNCCLNEKRFVLFDLDGTLTKSDDGIINSAIYMLKKRKLPIPPRSELFKMIGPPLRESFFNLFGISKSELEDAVADYREYYTEKGIFENELYNGIPELLSSLVNHGKILAVATSKAEPFAIQILKHFDLWNYFSVVRGSGISGGISEKAEVITAALADLELKEGRFQKSDVVMIGDRKHDIIGAKLNGIMSIGVLYGYGSKEELLQAGADAIAVDANEMNNLLV